MKGILNRILVKLKRLTKRSPAIRLVVRRLIYIFKSMFYLPFYLFCKTRPDTVLFEAYMGRSYACSPKALYEAMLDDEDFRSYEFIWAFCNCDNYLFLTKNRNTRIVKYKSLNYYITYAKSKYWISNSRIPEHIRRRRDQVYLQTWHGTPLKRLGYDLEIEGGNAINTIKEIRIKNDRDARRYTYLLSPSSFCTEKLTSSFNLKDLHSDDIIIEAGYPRNDFLFTYSEQDCIRIKKALGIPENKKVILYAPTWRDNQHEAGLGYTYTPGVDFENLRRQLVDEYVILFRAHYFVSNSFDFEAYRGFVLDVSRYDDINELYIISDLLITDYSSVFFDYANLKKPIIFYMYDLDDYKNQLRDFYIELDSLPGEIIQTEDELINAVRKSDIYTCYDERYQAFNSRFNHLDGPNTSKKVLKEVFKHSDVK